MSHEQAIYSEVALLPENLQREVLDYIGYLRAKKYVTSDVKITPQFGSAKGKYILQPDFDEPLDDCKGSV